MKAWVQERLSSDPHNHTPPHTKWINKCNFKKRPRIDWGIPDINLWPSHTHAWARTPAQKHCANSKHTSFDSLCVRKFKQYRQSLNPLGDISFSRGDCCYQCAMHMYVSTETMAVCTMGGHHLSVPCWALGFCDVIIHRLTSLYVLQNN